MIRNYPLNPEDSVRSNHIYEPARPLLQGGMKRRRNSSERAPRVPTPEYLSLHHKNTELYFIFLYEQNAFSPYKFIQDHFPHSIKLYFKERIQDYQMIERVQQHVQYKRLQHGHFPQRQLIQPRLFDRPHQAGKFKHLCKRATYLHHQEVHKKHQGSSAL